MGLICRLGYGESTKVMLRHRYKDRGRAYCSPYPDVELCNQRLCRLGIHDWVEHRRSWDYYCLSCKMEKKDYPKTGIEKLWVSISLSLALLDLYRQSLSCMLGSHTYKCNTPLFDKSGELEMECTHCGGRWWWKT